MGSPLWPYNYNNPPHHYGNYDDDDDDNIHNVDNDDYDGQVLPRVFGFWPFFYMVKFVKSQ